MSLDTNTMTNQVDFSNLEELTGGNNDALLSLLRVLSRNLRDFPGLMIQKFEEKKTDEMCEIAHKFKSSVSYLGYDDFSLSLSDLELAIENNLKEKEIERLLNLVKDYAALTLTKVEAKVKSMH